MRDPIRILIADDHDAARSALASLLESEPDVVVVGKAVNATDVITKAQRLRPDVVLMDARMPKVDGVDATRLMRGTWPTIQVIGLSVDDGDGIAERMREAGAFAFVRKDSPVPALLDAIRQAARLNTWAGEC